MNQSDKDFQAWIESCPDILKFRLEYVDVRADIEHVIQSYGYEFASEQTKQEVIEQVIEDFYDQDWADHNNFISYLLDRRLA
jgi:SOS response regulatory protein OraA/RecX|tara:strand:- start:1108 stop:1353 length:246 start_codon:yes stop_codon:yes gene_type:complete